jgi:hypothetical protein
MRILLDECVNPRLRAAFPGDAVRTVAEMNWRSLTNGRLLEEAAVHFDLLIRSGQLASNLLVFRRHLTGPREARAPEAGV